MPFIPQLFPFLQVHLEINHLINFKMTCIYTRVQCLEDEHSFFPLEGAWKVGTAIHQVSLTPFVKANCYKPHNGEEDRMAEA